MMRSRSRTLSAAGLLVAALAVLLVAWFLAGWADVRAQQRELRAEPARAAALEAGELARELRTELSRLIAREVERPYFHYQNLFHDPRTGASYAVSPSPLASGPEDPLVLGYFQLDPTGKLTTPTINDDVPHLSEPKRLAEHRRFRDDVVRGFVTQLAVARPGELVAEVAPVKRKRTPVPRQTAEPQPEAQAQVVQLDPNSYAQNNAPADVYWRNYLGNEAQQEQVQQRVTPPAQQQRVTPPAQRVTPPAQQQRVTPPAQEQEVTPPVQEQRVTPPAQQQVTPPAQQQQVTPPAQEQDVTPPVQAQQQQGVTPPAQPPPPPRVTSPAPRVTPPPRRVTAPRAAEPTEPAAAPKPVTITISPLEWETLPFAGGPALVAVRYVDTPDGKLAQGFVVDRSTVTSWLASRAGDAVAELQVGEATGATEIAPGWFLTVAPNPRALVEALGEAAAVARGFVIRFVLVGVIAALAAAFVVLLVARAERLARERSQFAAAAAHELRTPLAGLQLYGDMLADGLGDPTKLRDYARRMSEEAARLGRVVSNVLGFSQLERGNLSVEAKPGPLGAVLRELAERAEPALDRAGAALALDVAPELTARFDRDALTRIVGNLLDNAEKYGRTAEDRTIELAAREVGDVVEVVISDHGPGVTTAARSRLFRPFSRGVSSDGPAGLGLGLALSRSLAQAMGGELEYRPAAAGGAAFVLRLAKA